MKPKLRYKTVTPKQNKRLFISIFGDKPLREVKETVSLDGKTYALMGLINEQR